MFSLAQDSQLLRIVHSVFPGAEIKNYFESCFYLTITIVFTTTANKVCFFFFFETIDLTMPSLYGVASHVYF